MKDKEKERIRKARWRCKNREKLRAYQRKYRQQAKQTSNILQGIGFQIFLNKTNK